MDKDEILAKSREEHKDRDYVEAEAMVKANSIALSVGFIVCGALTILHAVFADTPDYAVWTVYFSVLAAIFLVKFARLRRRHELIMGLLYLAFCLFFFAFYLRTLLGWA